MESKCNFFGLFFSEDCYKKKMNKQTGYKYNESKQFANKSKNTCLAFCAWASFIHPGIFAERAISSNRVSMDEDNDATQTT